MLPTTEMGGYSHAPCRDPAHADRLSRQDRARWVCMIDLANALTTGATVAGALKGLSALEAFFQRRSTNGNGKHSDTFTLADHDAILLSGSRLQQLADDHKAGFEMLHDDLVDVKQEIRDLRA